MSGRFFSSIPLLALLAGLAACGELPVQASNITPPAPVADAGNLPSPVPTATPSCPPGRIDSLTIPTQYLEKPLQAFVYLPPCYDRDAGKRYPVLYLLHGLYATNDQWLRIGAPAAADRLTAAGAMPGMIIVMPYDPSVFEPPFYEFDQAVAGDLVPAVDARYRTLADRQHRAVGGLSRGGAWAIHLGLTRPDLFGAAGAHSVVVFSNDVSQVGKWLAAIPPSEMPRFYLDIGEYDGGLADALKFEATLSNANVPHEWHLNLGSHDEPYWSAHIQEYLLWYAAGW